MLPWAVTIIPKYEMIVKFGWLEFSSLIIQVWSWLVSSCSNKASPGISNELIEAARVDGGSVSTSSIA